MAEVTITNLGGSIRIYDTRFEPEVTDLTVLKDGISIKRFGNIVRITLVEGNWLDIDFNEVNLINFTYSTLPTDSEQFYDELWNIIEEYCDCSGNGGSQLNETTGILYGGDLSATIGGTTFSVTAGIGQIVTQIASISGVATTVNNVTWSAVTGAAITNIGTSQFTYILVDNTGTVIQQTTPFTDAQYKTHIIIGILCHIDFASVNLVTNDQNVAYEDPHRLVELITAFGPIKKTGLNIGSNGANLRVNRTSGEAFKIGANYITDQFEPDVATISAQTPAKLCRVHRDGSGGFIFDTFGGVYYDDIDPNQYDDGSGTLAPVPSNRWTIQRLFFFPNNPNDIICYYGVQLYNNFSEARANLEFETFDEATITAENAVFLGFLFVRHNATDLTDPTFAAFLQSGLFRGIPPGGGGSGGGTSLSLETNGTPNGSQTLLNLVEGANMTITDDGLGNITFDAASGGGVPDIAIYPYAVATYLGDINPLDIHVSATEDRLYLPANSSGTIKFYEASTNVLLGSVALSNVGSCFYIESTGELWATNLSNGTINRYDAATPGASLGTITGSGTRGIDHIEYSATKVFISNFASNSVTVVNPLTNTVDATISSASLGGTGVAGMVYVDNPLSDHDGLIAVILRSTNEVALIDPATNTVVAAGVNPSSKLNSPVYIAYDIATDQYFITNANGKNISVLTPASATTFTYVKNIDGIVNPFGIVSDETTGLVYVCFGSNNTSTSNGIVSVSVIDPSTNSIVKTIMTLGYNSSTVTVYNIDIDSTNGYIYVNGFSGSIGGNIVNKLKIR
jgi:hypothetical protein